MNVIHCPKCKELVAKSARRCPECGYVLKTNWMVLIVGGIVIFCLTVTLLAPYLLKLIDDDRKSKPKIQIATELEILNIRHFF